MVSLLLPIIYLLFISLGLPDSLLGSSWPSIYVEFDVPVSYAGIISVIICLGTVVSSLNSDRLTKKFGPGLVSAVSVALTAICMFGFSISHSMVALCLWAFPYGLGGGSIDAALNNYIALHYGSKHMSWLHCMWGVGASIGPYILSYAISRQQGWNMGYRYISYIQLGITLIAFLSIPLWKKKASLSFSGDAEAVLDAKPLPLKDVLQIPNAKNILFCFFCYCGIESIMFVYASTFMKLQFHATAEQAASYGAIFYLGMTIGRAINGFATIKFTDKQLIRFGQCLVLVGLLAMVLAFGNTYVALAGILLAGLGCAPIYPCIINSTPAAFGADKSQAMIGVQMACAYMGSLVMPPLFGFVANRTTMALLPYFILALLLGNSIFFQRFQKLAHLK